MPLLPLDGLTDGQQPTQQSGAIPLTAARGLVPLDDPAPKPKTGGSVGNGQTLTHEQLRNLWISQGGDKNVADLMAHVAFAESGGNTHSNSDGRTSYTERGNRYYPQGLWQISTIHGPGNWFDPVTNVRKAIALYNAQGMGPWEDSRNKGAGGGWGQYAGIDFARGAGEQLPGHVTHPVHNGQLQPVHLKALDASHFPAQPQLQGARAAGLLPLNDPNAGKAKPAATAAPSNPMDVAQPTGGPGPIGGTQATNAHSALIELAGHQDLMFILHNAQLRDVDPKTGDAPGIIELLTSPRYANSVTRKAWNLYRTDPGQAMDEYGLGSPAQSKFMASHFPGTGEGMVAEWQQKLPVLNAIGTFFTEAVNPLSVAEGGVASKALEGLGAMSRLRIPGAGATTGADVGQAVARGGLGLGTPLYDIGKRGGTEGAQWAKGTIASLRAPHVTANLPSTNTMLNNTLKGLNNSEQREVVRLSQGLEPNPQFAGEHANLAARAKSLRADIQAVTAHQRRVRMVEHPNTFPTALDTKLENSYFPMRSSYGFGPEHDLINELRGSPMPGGLSTQDKRLANYDEAARAIGDDGKPLLDPDFSPAVNYANWREQALRKVAFHDAIERAPASLVRNLTKEDLTTRGGGALPALEQPHQQAFPGLERYGMSEEKTPTENLLDAWAQHNAQLKVSSHDIRTDELAHELGWMYNDPGDPRWVKIKDNPAWVAARSYMPQPTQALRGKMLAPELWDFLRNDTGLSRYIEGHSFMPGQESGTFWGKFVSMARNAIISSFWYHPTINISGNDAAARELYNLGGAQWSSGGYLYNAAKAIGMQARLVKPEAFVKSAQEYSDWLQRALVSGGIAEFGPSRTSALGGQTARVMTETPVAWQQRLDRVMTGFGEFNRERTFGSRGEEAFAVHLFKDAVEKGGFNDYDAAAIVRQSLGDYYNFDPKSPASVFLLFAPWLKSNAKFWTTMLVKRPQTALAPAHIIRNANLQESPDEISGPYAPPDFTLYAGHTPLTIPFVGRDVGKIAGTAGALTQGPARAMSEAYSGLQGRFNPVVRGALNAQSTIDALYSPNVEGPETNYNLIVNPKAPIRTQYQQLGTYAAAHFIPVPLFGYAWQDALRRGLSREDLAKAVIGASGLSFVGQDKLDDDAHRQVSRAQKAYKKAYDNYAYGDHDESELEDAWKTYMDSLRSAGVIH